MKNLLIAYALGDEPIVDEKNDGRRNGRMVQPYTRRLAVAES